MNENLILAAHIFSIALLMVSVFFMFFYRSNYKTLSDAYEKLFADNKKQKAITAQFESEVNSCNKKIVAFSDKIALLEKEIINQKMHNASLETSNNMLKKENSKLLKAASDDITINVKAMDDAKIIAENPKPKRRYNKKKRNPKS